MSDTSIIKEFLVALGFDVEEAKLKRFQKQIDQATKFVGELAVGVEAMAVAVEAAVVKVSSKFEDLYYASQRIGDGVENIRGYTFAIGQMGGTANSAMAALENMGEFFRSNPGAERFIRGLGIETRDANGEMRQMTGIMGDLASQLRSMPYYRAKVVAGVLGIDPRTLQAMLRDTGEAQSRYHELADKMGVDQDAAAKASHDFMNDIRELLAVVTLAADKVILLIQPFADKVVRYLEDLHEATDGWSTALIGLAVVVGPLLLLLDPIVIAIAALAAGIVWVIAKFSDWRTGLGGIGDGLSDIWDAIQPLVQAVEGFGMVLWKVFGPALRPILDTAFKLLADGLHLVADVIRVVIDLVTGHWSKAWQDWGRVGHDVVKLMGDQLGGLWKIVQAIGGGIADAWNWLNHKGQQAPGAAAGPPANDNAAAPGKAIAGAAQAIGSRVQAFFESHGFNHAQASGIAAGAYAETKLNPNAVNPTSGAFGIGQWLGSRKAELFRRYGRNPSLDQQLEFMLWELTNTESGAGGAIKRQSTAGGALDRYIRNFMRPGAGTGGDLQRGSQYLASNALTSPQPAQGGGKPVTVAQTTNITVDGSQDPHATGRAVAGEQARVNDQMARQLKTAAS